MEDAHMNDEIDPTQPDDVQRDGMAMVAILLLTIALIVFLGWQII